MKESLTETTRRRIRFCRALAAVLLGVALGACAVGTRLDTGTARPNEVTGTFSVYLYGCRYPSDIETMALLVDQTTPYPFDLVVLPASYRTKTGLAGPDALSEAAAFVQCGIYATGAHVLRSISDPAGKTIAFEIKPLYPRLEMGAEEVLFSDYFLRDDRVRAYFKLNPQVERIRNFDVRSTGDR